MLAVAAIVQAVAPAPAFAPPLDATLTVVTRRITERAGELRSFQVERSVVFRRDAQGLYAEVTLLRAEANSHEAWGSLFEAGYTSLAGHRLTMRLDSDGRVTAIEDIDALWERFCASVAELAVSQRITASPVERRALAERILVPLRAMPADRRIAIFATLVSELVAGDAFAGGVGSVTEVRVPGRTPLGGAVTVDGVRSIARSGPLLRSSTRAGGTVAVPATQGNDAGEAEMDVTFERLAEPDTGLIRSTREIVRSRIVIGDETQTQTITTTTAVTRDQ